ncbi:MAG TPA: GAF and ANTAR domain-containing protein [Dermatophilaceae bacterium]|nr:GAF and ANTAR domain-containing protein [Dermatophilaceae bacterium]
MTRDHERGIVLQAGDEELSRMIVAEELAKVFVEVADTLVDHFDLIEFLEMVTARTAAVSQAAAAGLLLADPHGQLQFMAASEESAKLVELFQVQTSEGPCQDCYRSGAPVVNADLDRAAPRWPRFAPRAVAAGFLSVHAFPLRHRRNIIGALNLFSRQAGHLDPADVRVVQALADIVTIGLLQERTIRHGEILTEQLQAALNNRIVIEQAKGAIAGLLGIPVDAAFGRLRAYARSNHLRVSEVAAEVIADPSSHAGLLGARSRSAQPPS